MPKVSFYLFETSQERQVDSACRLVRKLIKQQQKLWWYCPVLELQKELDEKLWTFDAESFIGHGINHPMQRYVFQSNCLIAQSGLFLILTIMLLNMACSLVTLLKLLKIPKLPNRLDEKNSNFIVV